jgi:hypothetical protein
MHAGQKQIQDNIEKKAKKRAIEILVISTVRTISINGKFSITKLYRWLPHIPKDKIRTVLRRNGYRKSEEKWEAMGWAETVGKDLKLPKVTESANS